LNRDFKNTELIFKYIIIIVKKVIIFDQTEEQNSPPLEGLGEVI